MRVVSVPEGHAYVRNTGGPGVVRLPDPPVPGAPAGQWWPSPWLDPERVRREAGTVDVYHLHFGFDACRPAQLSALVGALRAAGTPLVFTVHDLRNPHHVDTAAHDAALDVLVPAADALVTLTPGAAAEIARRWGRTARVIPHPHVVPLDRVPVPRPHEGFLVGVHAKSVRTNADPVGITRLLAAADVPDLRIRFDAHDDDRGRAAARAVAGLPGVEVHVHPPFTDDELWAYLESLDLSVLPHRWGTHSGWSEACHDLGTPVLVPDCGYYREQGPCLVHRWTAASVAAALHRARHLPRAPARGRAAQRERIAQAHLDLYRAVTAPVPA
ncbi:glycosyltransferase family 1 protein [Pseudonocardia sp. WMMC193]|uniref:glycosyltransferase family 1 protein n=1 Tax=Pseudonocardia sp. WMMC193 TaxID=2911965 RepID=UPI001F2E8497|nr:glycosyltransferase family 1 protein [Pseudonocardia sp. WMMC193]MCF7549375.1 glycosyltransferase family 1 protein [Pseudonocardia sp. WMMC193]